MEDCRQVSGRSRAGFGAHPPGRGVTGLPPLPPGVFRASFCPHVLGCRDQVITGDQVVSLGHLEPEVSLTVTVPEGKSLVLVRSALSSHTLYVLLALVGCSVCVCSGSWQ